MKRKEVRKQREREGERIKTIPTEERMEETLEVRMEEPAQDGIHDSKYIANNYMYIADRTCG